MSKSILTIGYNSQIARLETERKLVLKQLAREEQGKNVLMGPVFWKKQLRRINNELASFGGF